MRPASNVTAKNSRGHRQTRADPVQIFLTSIREIRRLAALFLITLLAGVLSSPAAQKFSLLIGIVTASTFALYCYKRRSKLESAWSMAAATAGSARRCTSTLLLRTITHLTRVEALIRRPGGQGNP